MGHSSEISLLSVKDTLGSCLLSLVVPLNKRHVGVGVRSTVPCSAVEPLNKGHIRIRSTVPCSAVEPLNKGHIGIRSTVPCSAVEPLNKGHVGIRSTVPCSAVEPLNKGHIGIRSTVPCSTVEPLNKGHIGIRSTVSCIGRLSLSQRLIFIFHYIPLKCCHPFKQNTGIEGFYTLYRAHFIVYLILSSLDLEEKHGRVR